MAWEVVRTTAVDALVRRNPPVAAALAPDNPSVRIALSMAEFRRRLGKVSGAPLQGGINALGDYPIAEEPFLLAAVSAFVERNDARGEALLLEARRRNPRSRLSRLLLLDRYLRTGRTTQAAEEIAAMTRLIARAGEVLVPELARMAAVPDQRRSLKTVLANDPVLLDALLTHLAGKRAEPALILDLAEAASPRARARGGAWQAALIDGLIERGDVTGAYKLWQSFGGGAGAKDGGVYDGSFQGRPGLPPFNWRLPATGSGVAERAAGGGLDVTYYGRDSSELASQLLMLKPGSYRIQFRAEGDADGEDSKLVWRVACNGSKATVLELPLINIASAGRTIAGAFNVPASGCSAQWLKLDGVAGEIPGEQSVLIRDLQIMIARS